MVLFLFQFLQSLFLVFEDCLKATNYNSYYHHFRIPNFFQIFLHYFILTQWSFWTAKSTSRQVLFLLINFRSSFFAWDLVICLYLKVLENFMSWIFLERFWFVLLPFFIMVKLKFPSHFPADLLSHSVMLTLLSFYASLLHSRIMWLIISSLLLHNLPLLFYWILLIYYFTTLWVFHGSLSDNKSLQIFRTFLSILANLNNPVAWLVLIIPLFSISASLFSMPLGTIYYYYYYNYNYYYYYTSQMYSD